MSLKQHLPVKMILRSRKLTRMERAIAQCCVDYLAMLATRVQGCTHELDGSAAYGDKPQRPLIERLASSSVGWLDCTLQAED